MAPHQKYFQRLPRTCITDKIGDLYQGSVIETSDRVVVSLDIHGLVVLRVRTTRYVCMFLVDSKPETHGLFTSRTSICVWHDTSFIASVALLR